MKYCTHIPVRRRGAAIKHGDYITSLIKNLKNKEITFIQLPHAKICIQEG